LVVRVAPVSLLVSVTSALLPITACALSVIVPCRLAFAVAWPNRLAVLSRTKQLITATHSHLLLFILISPWRFGVAFCTFFRVPFLDKGFHATLLYLTNEHGYYQIHCLDLASKPNPLIRPDTTAITLNRLDFSQKNEL